MTRKVFATDAKAAFHEALGRADLEAMMKVWGEDEDIVVSGQSQPADPIVATNICVQLDRGWRMLLHHASPALREVARAEETAPSIWH